MKTIQEQLSMAQWMNSVERRLTAIEAQHRAAAVKLRELATNIASFSGSPYQTRARLRALANLLDGGSEEGRV